MNQTENKLHPGYNVLTEEFGIHQKMMMDIGVYVFVAGESQDFKDEQKESAFLLLDGQVVISWAGREEKISRASLFDDMPTCLHVPRGTQVTIKALTKAEILIQKTTNDKNFAPVFYTSQQLEERVLGGDTMQMAAKRVIRDIFTYDNAPYSNMVMGEIINLPGRWSSYPPHHHPQPEVYYYRFDKPQGFGCSIIGDQVHKITHGSISAIPGGLCHPQVAAPGYAMYYCWMIRHFDGQPWTERIFDPAHAWLQDSKASIWETNK